MMPLLILPVLCAQWAAQESALITNSYDPEEQRARPPVERVYLYRPETEWTYSHHPSITFFKGRFYAMWSNGREDEDAPGQRVLMCASDDFAHWSEPKPLVGPLQGKHSEVVLTASGFHQHEGTLAAYFGQYEYKEDNLQDGRRPRSDIKHQDTCLRAMTTTDGETWSGIIELGLPVVPNHPPQPTRSGRLIIACNISFPYTDEPSGLTGWHMSGVYPQGIENLYDDSEGFHIVQAAAGWPVGLCEGSFYQTDDGVLHMLMRSGTPQLWVTESRDDGATWSQPKPTEFTDNVAKFHLGRLPDGRFYHVGNSDPQPRGRRTLVLSLSDDGVRFDKHYLLADEDYEMKRKGLHKGGTYGYPHSMVHDGHFYVIVSLKKEGVAVMRVPLSTL